MRIAAVLALSVFVILPSLAEARSIDKYFTAQDDLWVCEFKSTTGVTYQQSGGTMREARTNAHKACAYEEDLTKIWEDIKGLFNRHCSFRKCTAPTRCPSKDSQIPTKFFKDGNRDGVNEYEELKAKKDWWETIQRCNESLREAKLQEANDQLKTFFNSKAADLSIEKARLAGLADDLTQVGFIVQSFKPGFERARESFRTAMNDYKSFVSASGQFKSDYTEALSRADQDSRNGLVILSVELDNLLRTELGRSSLTSRKLLNAKAGIEDICSRFERALSDFQGAIDAAQAEARAPEAICVSAKNKLDEANGKLTERENRVKTTVENQIKAAENKRKAIIAAEVDAELRPIRERDALVDAAQNFRDSMQPYLENARPQKHRTSMFSTRYYGAYLRATRDLGSAVAHCDRLQDERGWMQGTCNELRRVYGRLDDRIESFVDSVEFSLNFVVEDNPELSRSLVSSLRTALDEERFFEAAALFDSIVRLHIADKGGEQ